MANVLYSDDSVALQYEAHRLSNELTNVKHLCFDNNHGEIIDEIGQTDLFNNNLTYIVHNAKFVLGKKTNDKDLANKIAEIDANIYLLVESKKLDDLFQPNAKVSIKKIAKFNASSAKRLVNAIIEKSNVQFQNSYVQDKFENLLSSDPFLIENETNKIVLASENGIITEATVQSVIDNSSEVNVFKMVNFLLTNNRKQLITLYDNLILAKFQPVELIQIMASQLFNLKMYKMASSTYSPSDIENMLGMSRFIQNTNRTLSMNVSINQLDQLINDLLLLDYNIKHSLVDPCQGLKLLIAK